MSGLMPWPGGAQRAAAGHRRCRRIRRGTAVTPAAASQMKPRGRDGAHVATGARVLVQGRRASPLRSSGLDGLQRRRAHEQRGRRRRQHTRLLEMRRSLLFTLPLLEVSASDDESTRREVPCRTAACRRARDPTPRGAAAGEQEEATRASARSGGSTSGARATKRSTSTVSPTLGENAVGRAGRQTEGAAARGTASGGTAETNRVETTSIELLLSTWNPYYQPL